MTEQELLEGAETIEVRWEEDGETMVRQWRRDEAAEDAEEAEAAEEAEWQAEAAAAERGLRPSLRRRWSWSRSSAVAASGASQRTA